MKTFNRSKRHPFPIFSGIKIDLGMLERKINTELAFLVFSVIFVEKSYALFNCHTYVLNYYK